MIFVVANVVEKVASRLRVEFLRCHYTILICFLTLPRVIANIVKLYKQKIRERRCNLLLNRTGFELVREF